MLKRFLACILLVLFLPCALLLVQLIPTARPQGPQGGTVGGVSGGGVNSNSPLPLATSGPGPVFNVANYTGVFHDTRSNPGCDSSIANSQVTCSAVAGITPFTAADVGKRFNCSDGVSGLFYPAGTTITSVVSGTVAQLSGTRLVAGPCRGTYGHPDDVAIQAAFTAALAQSSSQSGQARGNAQVNTAAPTLYLTAGGWMSCAGGGGGLPTFYFGNNRKGFTIAGDGYDQTYLYNCDAAAAGAMTFFGFWVGNANMTNLFIRDFTIDGGFLPVNPNGFGAAIYSAPAIFIKNVHLQAIRMGGGATFQGGVFADNLVADTSDGTALLCNGCGGEFHNWSVSNSANNLTIQNVVGLNTGPGLRMWGGLVDEGGSTPVTKIINSQDVWFIGTAGFGTGAAYAMSVDATSFIHLTGGIWGVFGNDGNAGGISIAAGGVVQASDVRFVSSGTRASIANLGTLNDNGGNSSESMFPIASGTSTGTVAVLTLTTLGANVNANCSVGDALIVEGTTAGYNGYFPAGATSGITAVTATTLTYTTAGSNLGAAAAVGVAFCRNLQTYTGTLPRALLNNPIPNTCYVTGTFGATTAAAPMCTFQLGSATNINFISASSTTTTACTVAPVVTITDGTVSQTLTITTAKSIWKSNVDASTGVGTSIFKPNGSVTLSNTAGTCTTPPTNFAVSYNISPILSN
jgi:hypothetical protein